MMYLSVNFYYVINYTYNDKKCNSILKKTKK